jgi:hypothetical protein
MDKAGKIDINSLPEGVRRELFDYYEFLLQKYMGGNPVKKKRTGQKSLLLKKEIFFQSVRDNSFSLPGTFKFDREESHAR